MSYGSIIQISSLEIGDRIVVTEKTSYVPSVLLISYPDDTGEAQTTRYLRLDALPEHVRKLCEQCLTSLMD